jgi:phage terminase large subunit
VEVTIANSKFKEFLKPARYKIAHGGRSGGKSLSIATLLLIIGMKHKKRILCTREIQNSIGDSVLKVLSDLINKYKWEGFYSITKNSVVGRNGTEFIFKGLKTHLIHSVKSIEGIDICWIEEAQAVSMPSLEVLDPTIRKEGSEIWISLNRFFENDPVWERYVKNKRPRTILIKSNYYDVNPKLLPSNIAEMANADKQIDYSNYMHIWEGDPKNDTEKTWIQYKLLQNAINRDVSDAGMFIIGVDVARFGDDRTVFFKRKGLKILDYRIFEKKDIVEVSKELDLFSEDKSITVLNIDDTGVGGGLTDIMRHKGYSVNAVNNGAKADDPDKYVNTISEMWGDIKNVLDIISIPDYPELIQELNARYYGFDNGYRFKIESKDDYKKRMQKSPDLADSFLLCYKGVTNHKVDYQDVLEDIEDTSERESLSL